MSHDNSNRLALWKNDKREKATHPHLKGKGETTQHVWVSAWFSPDLSDDDKRLLKGILERYQSKKPFLSISITPQENMSQKPAQTAHTDDFDDDIPF